MFQAERQATKTDHPFDRRLYEGYRLAEKGLDPRQAAELRRARVQLLMWPELDPERRARLEEERQALEDRATASLDSSERQRLARAGEVQDEAWDQLERSLKRHLERAELRLQPAARDRLLQARSVAPKVDDIDKLRAEKEAIEAKAWETLNDRERAALAFFEDSLPLDLAEREQVIAERKLLEERALASLPAEAREKLEAWELQQRAEASLESGERRRLDRLSGRLKLAAEIAQLRAQAEAALDPGERATVLRARLLERRDQAEAVLSPQDAQKLLEARRTLIRHRELEQLEEQLAARLSTRRQLRLKQLKGQLELREARSEILAKAERSLGEEERERLVSLRKRLKLGAGERQWLQQRFEELAYGQLSAQPGSFGKQRSEVEAARESQASLEELLAISPFNEMLERCAQDEDEAGAERLFDLLMRESRIRVARRQGERRDVIVRQGDYGSSAFLILEGRVRILLQDDEQVQALAAALGSSSTRRLGLIGLLRRWLGGRRGPEVRERLDTELARHVGEGVSHQRIPNFARLPALNREATLGEGEVFGEIAAQWT